MKTASELAYFTLRARQSHAAAGCAGDVCARDAHKGLAVAYDLLVTRMTATASPAPALLSPAE